jgi:site-specific recombinase XerD
MLASLVAGKQPDDFLLPRYRPFISGGGAKVLNEIQDHLGIKKTNFHSIRASFITHLHQAGVPIGIIQQMVGHTDLNTTQRYLRFCEKDFSTATFALDKVADTLEITSTDDFEKALANLA